jgi:hypothetical protein
MPKLVLYAACEKIIIDQNNLISLMSLLQDINVQVRPGIIVPVAASAPMQWTIVSIWQQQTEDQGKTFEQRSGFVSNSGQTLLETPIAVFELKTPIHRIVSQIVGMPVGIEGKHSIMGWLREKGATEWTEVGSYPIEIKWVSSLTPPIH